MRAKGLFALGLAATLGLAIPVQASDTVAQRMITSQATPAAVEAAEIAGPTRYIAVPRADVLSVGSNVISTNILLGAAPVGLSPGNAPGVNLFVGANALAMRADFGIAPNTELGTGIAYVATNPWIGQLNLTSKYSILSETVAPIGLAGVGGFLLTSDANGLANLGLVLGIPLTRTLLLGANPLVLTLAPQVNMGWVSSNLSTARPGGFGANLGMGFGGMFGVTNNLYVLADSNLGFPTAGLISDTSFGIRYAFTPTVTGDLFLGVKNIPANLVPSGSLGTLTSLGAGFAWKF